MQSNQSITIQTVINAPLKRVWHSWTTPTYISQWCFATPEWHMPSVNQDFRIGGQFSNRMEARDGSMGFDFAGTFDEIRPYAKIDITLSDGRKWETIFDESNGSTTVIETFDAENENPLDMQEAGWMAILQNFKDFVENKSLIKLVFPIQISASPNNVFENMLSPEGYAAWTSVFNGQSSFNGTWTKGGKMYFTGVSESGEKEGMVSMIEEITPNVFVSIAHIGMVKGNEETLSGPAVDAWAGSHEDYHYEKNEGGCLLTVKLDSVPEYADYFREIYPKALEKLKEICEA